MHDRGGTRWVAMSRSTEAVGANSSDHYSTGMLSHEMPTERLRLRLMEKLLDPETTRVFERLGIRSS